MWDFLPLEDLIAVRNIGNYGLAEKKLYQQLEEIRALPEVPPATDEKLNNEENS